MYMTGGASVIVVYCMAQGSGQAPAGTCCWGELHIEKGETMGCERVEHWFHNGTH